MVENTFLDMKNNKIMSKVTLLNGDCLQKLKELKDNSVDSVVTDPPYEIGFMGKGWDDSGIANNPELWKEVLRVLKPGGHLLSFSHSRTYHRQAVAVEDAGFDIRDQIMWIYGSGFPKSHNIGKAVDKIQGNDREVVGISKNDRPNSQVKGGRGFDNAFNNGQEHQTIMETKGTSPYEGWGTALKPAHEPIVMARKPLSEKTIVKNVLEHGTGGINIDGCRVDNITEKEKNWTPQRQSNNPNIDLGGMRAGQEQSMYNTEGRFPANIIFDEESGNEEWKRYFYCPKASKKDRDEGNIHPTVKPTDLMAYLIRLVTPKGGVVLDPFMGSGSTGKAAVREGMDFIGIEREKEYIEIAQARIEAEEGKHTYRTFFE